MIVYREEKDNLEDGVFLKKPEHVISMQAILKNKLIVGNLIAGAMFIFLNVLYIIANDSCPYSYDDPNI